MAYKKIKLPESREAWLEQRRQGLGGSDAGAVMGLNKYKSPFTLWAEKTGKINDELPDNESMRVGRDLEDYVAKRFTEATGKKVRRSGFSYQSDEHPFMLANVDRWVVGENAILECKTANARSKTDYMHGDIPDSYYCQCLHYMAVTGAEKAYIAILVMGVGFHYFEIERNEEEISALIEAEKEFWKFVQNDVEPPIDETDSTSETLSRLYPNSSEKMMDLTVYDLGSSLDVLDRLKQQKKEVESGISAIENSIKAQLKGCERGQTDEWIITWKTSKPAVRLDSKKLQKELPDIYEQYSKEGKASRPFRVTKKKKEE